MSQPIEQIEAEALQLSRHDRAKVALHLLDSLEQETPEFSPEAIEKAWLEESAKRLEAYRSGDMRAYPAEEIIAELGNL